MPEENANLVMFRVMPDLQAHLAARTNDRTTDEQSTNLIARRDLERYYAVLRDSLQTVTLTEGEASALVDALNGTLLEAHTYSLLWANVADAIRYDGLAEKWGIDGPALVAKLRALSPGAAMAVVDAAERYFVLASRIGSEDLAETLRAVGLLR
jgi:hypothetical protein